MVLPFELFFFVVVLALWLTHSRRFMAHNIGARDGSERALSFRHSRGKQCNSQPGVGPRSCTAISSWIFELVFGRNTERMDSPTWDGVETSQRELVSERWKQNGMRPDDIGILSDLDEVFSREFLLAAQSCDILDFRQNLDCHKRSPECITDPTELTWYHPDMILGECIDKIGDPTIRKPVKRYWNGKGPRVEGYGDNPDRIRFDPSKEDDKFKI